MNKVSECCGGGSPVKETETAAAVASAPEGSSHVPQGVALGWKESSVEARGTVKLPDYELAEQAVGRNVPFAVDKTQAEQVAMGLGATAAGIDVRTVGAYLEIEDVAFDDVETLADNHTACQHGTQGETEVRWRLPGGAHDFPVDVDVEPSCGGEERAFAPQLGTGPKTGHGSGGDGDSDDKVWNLVAALEQWRRSASRSKGGHSGGAQEIPLQRWLACRSQLYWVRSVRTPHLLDEGGWGGAPRE